MSEENKGYLSCYLRVSGIIHFMQLWWKYSNYYSDMNANDEASAKFVLWVYTSNNVEPLIRLKTNQLFDKYPLLFTILSLFDWVQTAHWLGMAAMHFSWYFKASPGKQQRGYFDPWMWVWGISWLENRGARRPRTQENTTSFFKCYYRYGSLILLRN